jgi:uncharacterized protein (TIGR03435 family)
MFTFDDMDLLREYACSGSEKAFATLVSRHIHLVYSVALRHVRNAHQAEEICQAVFMILAKKAAGLKESTVLAGWLYSTARLTAANYLRSEICRIRREQEAHMQLTANEPEPETWRQIAPHLDLALADLNEMDRNAIVLRFFNSKSFQEVGTVLGTSEDAAKMRVSRAVEKLRKFFANRGIVLPAAVLCGMITAHSVQAAPAGLAASVTAFVIQGSSASASILTIIKGTLKIMAWTKAKTAAAVAIGLVLATGTTTVTVKKILDHRTYPWQVQSVNTGVLNQVPPQVRIVPTKFPQFGGGWGASDDKVLGINQTLQTMLLVAYGAESRYRMISSVNLPEGNYDFIANLPQGSREALQREIERKFRVRAVHENRQVDVLRLAVDKAGADGLRPSESNGGSAQSSAGQFACVNQPLSCLTSMLENQLKLPVMDHTGLTGRFDIDLSWEQRNFQTPAPESLKQALADELGLQLVAAKENVQMLIVKTAR